MGGLNEVKLDQICDALYEAAAVPELWRHALAKLSWGFEADSGHFVVWNKATATAELAVTARADPPSEQTYALNYGAIDPSRQALEYQIVGHWLSNHRLFSEAFMAEHRYYREFLYPLGFQFTTKCRVYEERERPLCSIFGFVRRIGADPFEGAALDEAAAVLTPHLARAAKLHHKLAAAYRRGRLVEAALDRLACGLVLNGPDGKVAVANKAALALVEGANGLTLRDGCLRARDHDADQVLRTLVRESRNGGSLLVPRPGRSPLALTVAPLPEAVELPSLAGSRGTLVLIADRETRASRELGDVLRQLFGLSGAEARVACLLVRGRSLGEAASLLKVSEGTARSQLKQVYAKMGVSRQSELVATAIDLDQLRQLDE